MRTHVSIADRIGNGIVAGFIATLVLSALHEPITLVTTLKKIVGDSIGMVTKKKR